MSEYTPNPYGGYYEGPSSGALSLAPGTGAMMGMPRGGFNPTPDEYWQRRGMNQERERFLSDVYRRDPRAQSLASTLQYQLWGDDHKAREAFFNKTGGPGNFLELTSWALNHPAVAGLAGGSVHSLATGALAATSGGMTMAGRGGAAAIYGDSMLSHLAARHLVQNVNRQFYTSSGGAILSATQGLSRDQIGGIMMQAGGQGAFAGLDIGSLVGRGSQQMFRVNDASLEKITSFTKTAAKFVSSLIDVFGQGSIGQLLGKAQSITGLDLSRIENAGIINQRIAGLRGAASAYGLDTASVFALAESGTAMGQKLGLHGATAGALSDAATRASLSDFVSRRTMGGNMYLPSASPMELLQTRMAEMTAMAMQDPLGQLRMTTELMFESGYGNDAQRKLLRSRLAAARPGDEHALNTLVADTLGHNPADMMFKFGGPGGVARALSSGGMANVLAAGADDLRSRQEDQMRRMFTPAVMAQLTGTSFTELSSSSDPAVVSALKAIQGNPLLATYRNAIDLESDARRMMLASGGRLSAADQTRGGALMSGSFGQGILDKLSGADPGSHYQMLAAFGGKNILGLGTAPFSLDADVLARRGGLRENFQNLRNAVNAMDGPQRRKGIELLQTLGVGSAGEFDEAEVMKRLRNPSIMGQINQNWVSYVDDQGNTQLAPKALSEMLKNKEVTLAQMRGAAVLLGKPGQPDSLLGKMVDNLARGGSDEDWDRQFAAFHREMTHEETLKRFSADYLKKLSGGAHGGLGKAIANALYTHKGKYEQTIFSKPGSAEAREAEGKLTKIEEKLASLRQAGVYSDQDLGLPDLTGRLILESANGVPFGSARLEARMKDRKGTS